MTATLLQSLQTDSALSILFCCIVTGSKKDINRDRLGPEIVFVTHQPMFYFEYPIISKTIIKKRYSEWTCSPTNVQSLVNKVDKLRARISFQRDIRDCNILCFMES
jgi:hypothetical protein